MSIVLMMFMMQGCGAKNSICPAYPKPTQDVLNKIQSLKDDSVDKWMIEQYKLNIKLGVCRE